ncbi:MAG: hypothetical protein F6K09_00705 [Merismopedia sp. SIO2A8]|nr:hypothetical protein [Symploca sp. SIO2B6]NET47272.1 hypothetical protein [Merismopedia sp. SIO2A8]
MTDQSALWLSISIMADRFIEAIAPWTKSLNMGCMVPVTVPCYDALR